MILTQLIQDFIKNHAADSMKEVCGLILLKDGYYEPMRCNNASNNPEEHFIIDYCDYLNAVSEGEIVAVYHSHNDNDGERYNSVSLFDVEQAKKHNLIYIMYHVPRRTFSYIDPKNSNCKYLGREFKIGVSDCFTILRDFYQEEFNIPITNYRRDCEWQLKNRYIMEENFEREGFVVVNDLKYGDILLFNKKLNGISEHIGIYIGNNFYLHQSDSENSNITYYSDFYKKRTKFVLRHNTKLTKL